MPTESKHPKGFSVPKARRLALAIGLAMMVLTTSCHRNACPAYGDLHSTSKKGKTSKTRTGLYQKGKMR